MSEWQPIETAPRDKPILVYCPEPVELDSHVWCWPEAATLHVLPARWHEPDGRTTEPAGWYAPMFSLEFGPYDDPYPDIDGIQLKPTHWQPLPTPPKDAR